MSSPLARSGAMRSKSTFDHSCLFENKSLQASSESRAHSSECTKLNFAAPGPGITWLTRLGSRLSSAASAMPSSAWKAPSLALAATHPPLWSWAATSRSGPEMKEEQACDGPFPWLTSVCPARTLHLLFHTLLAGRGAHGPC